MSVMAIEAREFGGTEVLTQVSLPEPVPGPGEAVIAVSVADVLFLDTMIRSGLARDAFPQRPPYIPGNGVAGHVAAVGDGADPAWSGRRVVARTGPPGGCGGYSERTLVTASRLVTVPEAVDLRVAAALMHDGATALGLLAGTPVKPGETVLVVGAAGSADPAGPVFVQVHVGVPAVLLLVVLQPHPPALQLPGARRCPRGTSCTPSPRCPWRRTGGCRCASRQR